MRVTLDKMDIQSINIFHTLTGSSVVDCLDEDDIIFFIVAEGQYGLAVGKDGNKIKNAERLFKKMIKVYEYSADLRRFVFNLIPESQEITVSDKIVYVKMKPGDRAKVIGKGGKNIRVLTKILQRLFGVEELRLK